LGWLRHRTVVAVGLLDDVGGIGSAIVGVPTVEFGGAVGGTVVGDARGCFDRR